MILSAGSVGAHYRHNQGPTFIDKTISSPGHSVAVDAPVSIALTYLEQVMKIYVDGVFAGQATGCTPPRFWGDNWNAPYAGLVLSGHAALTISDARLSRLARVPGETPVAP